jgi:long-subunit fatty acid transport protein
LYNPAGMALVSGPEAIVGYQYRFGLNNIAASYVNKATRELGFGQALLYSGDKSGLLTEMYFVSAAAYKFKGLFSFLRPLSVGVSFKVVSETAHGDTSTGNASSLGAGIDLGLLWELSDQIRYGLLLRDVPVINRWHNSSTGERYNEALATTLHMGGSYKVGYTTFLIAEGQIPVASDQPWKMAGGIEQELFRVFVARLGLQKEIQSLAETPWNITGGFGLKVDSEPVFGRSLSLDGSYEYNTLGVFPVVNVSFKIGF